MTGAVVLVLRLLAAAALYSFLGFAMWMMWQELRRASAAAADLRVPQLRLEILAKAKPVTVRLFTQPEVIIGRDPFSDLPLDDRAVSSRHARLSHHHGQWWIDDLDSKNGTRLNRDRLAGSTVLTSGDEIKCGSVRLIVKLPLEDDSRVQEGTELDD